jgi:hypothetical protein
LQYLFTNCGFNKPRGLSRMARLIYSESKGLVESIEEAQWSFKNWTFDFFNVKKTGRVKINIVFLMNTCKSNLTKSKQGMRV